MDGTEVKLQVLLRKTSMLTKCVFVCKFLHEVDAKSAYKYIVSLQVSKLALASVETRILHHDGKHVHIFL
jgi:hypothetical protein